MRLAHLSLFHARAAIQAEVDVSVVVEELLQHVQHARHLGEDQHPVTPGLQLPQQSMERLQLTCAQRQVKKTHAFNNDSDSYILANIFCSMLNLLGHFRSKAHLTTVVLDEPQVWELSPHVALDTVKTAGQRGDLGGQRGGEIRLLLAQRGRGVGGVHGDGRSLHRRDRKCEPSNWQKKQNVGQLS